jgi:hypothetical protein
MFHVEHWILSVGMAYNKFTNGTVVGKQQFLIWKIEIQWENGLGGLGRLKRIFQIQMPEFQAKKSKKIRSDPPDPPHPFSHCISLFQMRNGWSGNLFPAK